jgi:hypothetical protein
MFDPTIVTRPSDPPDYYKFRRRFYMNRTRISMMILSCICFTALTQPVWGQTGVRNPRTVPGHLTAGTINHAPMVVVDNLDLALASLTTFGGTFTFKITITVKSTNLGSDTIICGAGTVVDDINMTTGMNSGSYIEEASLLASRSGSTATCTVNIPYSWGLANGSTDVVALFYTIDATTQTAGSFGEPSRVNQHFLASIKVPANGTTTTISAAATI